MDFYLNSANAYGRLVKEWIEHDKLIIAYDFDNTVFDYHNEGHSYDDVIRLLRLCKQIGAYFIVFTSCEEVKYPMIINYLKENDIPFDTINENIDFIPFKGKKVYYNILLDDRAGLESAYRTLSHAYYKVCSLRQS